MACSASGLAFASHSPAITAAVDPARSPMRLANGPTSLWGNVSGTDREAPRPGRPAAPPPPKPWRPRPSPCNHRAKSEVRPGRGGDAVGEWSAGRGECRRAAASCGRAIRRERLENERETGTESDPDAHNVSAKRERGARRGRGFGRRSPGRIRSTRMVREGPCDADMTRKATGRSRSATRHDGLAETVGRTGAPGRLLFNRNDSSSAQAAFGPGAKFPADSSRSLPALAPNRPPLRRR
ncbi:hypothetical protein LzC2_37800 [Planctomycetes bacterium LzC2]|uniref:Uncharacterized protein n=1 Tax=Alienimonas chondri TaxID=2681879 RepID=A0ABX1VHT7_9PLAN|nr:hypothetical protein [Alienimonas chondri]